MSASPDPEQFLSRVDALVKDERLGVSALAAGILVALDMGIADTRGFARVFGVEHALVLREVAHLSAADALVRVTGRHPKTLRTTLALSDRGAELLKSLV